MLCQVIPKVTARIMTLPAAGTGGLEKAPWADMKVVGEPDMDWLSPEG